MKFGIDDAKTVTVDLDELVSGRMLIQANSGGGKSWLNRYILEQTHGHLPQIVIDPEGEFASLREKYDYVHAAPTGGDTVANPRSAALLALKLLELRASAIVDIYELHPHERIRFVRLFLEALVNAPKKLWGETLIVVDEAHTFAPEKGSAESLSAMIGLASLGRKRGFAALYATQRIQKLHKDACADLVNKLIGRTTLDVDVKRAAEELGFLKDRQRELKDLRPGQFFATGPAFNVRDITRVDVGRVHTTHPKSGKKRIAFVPPPPTAKIRALLPQLADLPAEAEKKAKTEEDLRAEISMLRKELSRTSKEQPPAEPKIVEVSVLTDADRQEFGRLSHVMHETNKTFEALRAAVFAHSESRRPQNLPEFGERAVRKAQREMFRALLPPPRPPSKPVPALHESLARMPKGQRQILTVLAQSPEGSTKARLAILAGYSPSGGGFNNYLGALRSSGCIEGSEPIKITTVGLNDLGPYEALPTGDALVQFWLGKLSKAERAILEVLVNASEGLSKEDLAHFAGYEPNGGGFNNALGRLRTIELVEGKGTDLIRAAAALTE